MELRIYAEALALIQAEGTDEEILRKAGTPEWAISEVFENLAKG